MREKRREEGKGKKRWRRKREEKEREEKKRCLIDNKTLGYRRRLLLHMQEYMVNLNCHELKVALNLLAVLTLPIRYYTLKFLYTTNLS